MCILHNIIRKISTLLYMYKNRQNKCFQGALVVLHKQSFYKHCCLMILKLYFIYQLKYFLVTLCSCNVLTLLVHNYLNFQLAILVYFTVHKIHKMCFCFITVYSISFINTTQQFFLLIYFISIKGFIVLFYQKTLIFNFQI